MAKRMFGNESAKTYNLIKADRSLTDLNTRIYTRDKRQKIEGLVRRLSRPIPTVKAAHRLFSDLKSLLVDNYEENDVTRECITRSGISYDG